MHSVWTVSDLTYAIVEQLDHNERILMLRVSLLFLEVCAPYVWKSIPISFIKDFYDTDSEELSFKYDAPGRPNAITAARYRAYTKAVSAEYSPNHIVDYRKEEEVR